MSEEMRKKFANAVKPVSNKVTGGYQKKENESVQDAKVHLNQEADNRRNEKNTRKSEHLEAVQRKKQHKAKI